MNQSKYSDLSIFDGYFNQNPGKRCHIIQGAVWHWFMEFTAWNSNYVANLLNAITYYIEPFTIIDSQSISPFNFDFHVFLPYYTPHTKKLLGGILVLLRPSVCPSVRRSVGPSVRPASRFRSVASTVQDGFFPYLVQMINGMRGCVACDDLWPWPISSRSFDLDLENRVRSVASTVLDGFFLYLAQMITIIRGCVACYVFFRICKFEFLAIFKKKFCLDLEKKSTVLDGFFPYLAQMITSMRGCVAYNDLLPWSISSRSFGLGLENRVRSVTSTVLDGFFPYMLQMITSMGRCVACDDLWPWPISSRSFENDFENRVRFVRFSVLDRLFPYLPQIITIIRGSVAC